LSDQYRTADGPDLTSGAAEDRTSPPATFVDTPAAEAPRTFVDAPRTFVDVPAEAPRTFVDTPVSEAPRTFVDAPAGDAPRTFVDAPAEAPRTFVDGAGAEEAGADTGPVQHVGINLPPPLAERYRVIRELAPGAEADVVEAEALADGSRVAIKVFRARDFSAGTGQIEALDRVGREYVVDVIERDHYGQKWWEVMPYLPHGSIADIRAGESQPWDPQLVRDLLAQVATALTHVHAQQLVHRDIKPQNLLVASLDPLHVVLGDFGLARVIAETREQHSTSRTIAYAPPEATAGVVSAAWDWWSLGMTVLELLRGQHPFQEPNGRWQSENVMLATVLDARGVPLTGVTDDRWQLLLRGLLTYDHLERWGPGEVTSWLKGGSPVVHQFAGTAQSPDKPHVRPFVFKGAEYTDSRELAHAMLAEPAETARLISGLAIRAPQSALLLSWLRSQGHDVQELMDSRVAERSQAILLTMLDPSAHPVSQGFGVSVGELPDLVEGALESNWRGPEAVAIESLRTSGALGVLSRLDGQGALALVDDTWQRTTFHLDTLMSRLPGHVREEVQPLGMAARGLLLASAASEGNLLPELGHGDPDALAQPWYANLMRVDPSAADGAARRVLAAVTRDLAANLTRQERTAVQLRERQELERRRRAEEQARDQVAYKRARSTAQLIAWAAVITSFFFGPLGVGLGIYSLRQSKRFNLPRRRRAWIAIIFGVITTISLLSSF
jgi:serine/threonine protein kinase